MRIRSTYPTRRLQDRILLFCMFFGMKIHSAIATLLPNTTNEAGSSYALRVLYACVTLGYCTYIKFMYRINSKPVAALFLLISITYTAFYTKEILDSIVETLHPYTMLSGLFCFVYQVAENYLIFKNEYLKLKYGEFPFIEKYHLYVLYFCLGISWNSIKTVVLNVYQVYPLIACWLLPDFALTTVVFFINTNIRCLRLILILYSIVAFVQTGSLIAIIFTLLESNKLNDVLTLVMVSLSFELLALPTIFLCLLIEIRKYLCLEEGTWGLLKGKSILF